MPAAADPRQVNGLELISLVWDQFEKSRVPCEKANL